MNERYIVDKMWFTGQECVGIVKVRDPYDGVIYYIGVGQGYDEDSDAEHIASWGAKLPQSAGIALFGPER